MTLKITETVDMELTFKLNDKETFNIGTRHVNAATRKLFRQLNAAPAMFDLLQRWEQTPYDEYHQQNDMRMEAAELIDQIRGAR